MQFIQVFQHVRIAPISSSVLVMLLKDQPPLSQARAWELEVGAGVLDNEANLQYTHLTHFTPSYTFYKGGHELTY